MLFQGDCHELIKNIENESVQLVYFDPPYGTTKQQWDHKLNFDKLWYHIWRILKPNGTVVIHTAMPFTIDVINSQRKYFKYCWYWHKTRKTGFLNAKRQPLRNMEEICVFYKNQCLYNPQMTQLNYTRYRTSGIKNSSTVSTYVGGIVTQSSEEYPSLLLSFNASKTSIKPEELCKYIIRTYTHESDTVLDMCMHTGVSGIATLKEGRNFIGFELNEEIFERAKKTLNRLKLFST